MPFRKLRSIESALAGPFHVAAEDDPSRPGERKAPTCPHCGVTMLWYESHLKRDNGRQKIVHSFHCPNCAYVTQTDEPFQRGLPVAA